MLILALAGPALAQPPSLEQALHQLDAVLAAGAAEPLALDAALSRVLAAAEAEPEKAPELVRHLAAQLRPLTGRASSDEARRQEVVRRSRATMRALSSKLRAGASSGPAQAMPLSAPPHDACADAIALTAGEIEATTSGATGDGGSSCGATGGAPDVWYTFTAASPGLVAWDTFGSSMDTVLSLHSACPDAGGDHELACNDDTDGRLESLVARDMAAGESVWVRVSGAAGASGDFTLDTDVGPGGIAGMVTKAGTGAPVAGAIVHLFTTTGGLLRSAESGVDGRYLVAGLSPSEWLLRASAPFLQQEVWQDHGCGAICDVLAAGDPVEVTAGLVDGIDFDLAPAGSIAGRVTDAETGAPLSVSVRAFDAAGAFVASDATDATGEYRIDFLPSLSYTVATTSGGTHADELYRDLFCDPSCDLTAGTPVAVTAGSTTPGIDFALARLGAISGTVTRASNGAPVAAAGVLAVPAEGGFAHSDSTDPQGFYRIDGLVPGTYFLRTSEPGWFDELYHDLPCEPSCTTSDGTPVTVAMSVETEGIHFALDELGRIAGVVRAAESDEPISARVLVHRQDGSLVGSVIADDGAYQVGGLVPGHYFVRTSTPLNDPAREDQLYSGTGCDPTCDVTSGTAVPVGLGTTTAGIDFALTACSASSQRTVSELLLFGVQVHEACRTLDVGPNVTVADGGRLVLRAGRSVRFGDGFSVASGGRLEVTIDPQVGLAD